LYTLSHTLDLFIKCNLKNASEKNMFSEFYFKKDPKNFQKIEYYRKYIQKKYTA